MPTQAIEVFLYGSLLDPAVLAARSGRRFPARALRRARLNGWRRVRLRGTPWPMLVRQRGASVEGLLLRLCGAPLRRLMAYEGSAYRLAPVRLQRGQAFAWLAQPSRADRHETV
ncbi:gamma-glutamylcyclotransferase family protein [Roseomonas sp. F4]